MKDFKQTINNFGWIFRFLTKKERHMLIIASTMILLSTAMLSIIPKILGDTVDKIATNDAMIWTGVCLIGVLSIFSLIFEVVRKYFIEVVSTNLQKKLVVSTSGHIIRLRIDWLNKQRSGGLNGRLQRSTEGAVKLLKLLTMDFTPCCLQMIFAVAMAFSINCFIGIILLIVVCIGIIIVKYQINSEKGIRIDLLRAREENDSNIVELLSGIESVRVANEEENQIQRIDCINEVLRKKEMSHHVKMILFDTSKQFNIIVWNIIVLSLGIYWAQLNIITAGDIITFSLLFNNVINPLNNIHRFIDEAHEASLKTDDLIGIFKEPIDQTYLTCTNNFNDGNVNNKALEIKSLSHCYGDNSVLNQINCTFEKGKYYGIIGDTGCGKSTLLKFILRLIPSTNNNVFLFDKEINAFSKEEISSLLTYMPQVPFVFNASIRDNLLFGASDHISDKDLWWALEKACLLEYVCMLKNGLDHNISERATNISGGQKQRIALARVFLKLKYNVGKHIVILDEATSALDNKTENTIIQNLLNIRTPNTTIIAIAHRYSTLMGSDAIINIDAGEIKEITTYNTLVS